MVEKWSKDTYSNSIRDTNHQLPHEQCTTSLIIKEMQVKILWDDFCHMSVWNIINIAKPWVGDHTHFQGE